MIDAAKLTEAMHLALLARSQSGPTANKPVAERKVPRASGLALGCPRQVFYYLVGAPAEPREPHSAAATQMGQDLEGGVLYDFITALALVDGDERPDLLESDPAFVFQQRVETDWFNGSADLVVTRPNGERLVVDSKTANKDSFDIKTKQGMGPEHRTQLSLYAHGVDADTIVVLLRNTDPRPQRGKPPMPVYHVQVAPRDDGAVEAAKVIAHRAMAARDSGREEDAPRAFEASAWQCRYCDFSSHCRRPGAR